MANDFQVRALELNGTNTAWDYTWICKTMDFMQKNNMNTLILHRNDYIDLIIYPGRYFGGEDRKYESIFERYGEIFRKLYRYTPTRRSSPYQRRAFLKRVLEQARRRNIDVYIENKELYFPEIILEFFPELVNNGKVCASHPFWQEFTKVKFREFFEEFPEIAGIITAPATGESRVSIKSNRCECDRCKQTKPEDWFRSLLSSMYEPIHEAGKKLVVRDFVFDSQAMAEIATVMRELPSDVAISLKNTPHDYYPPFPKNERIGQVGDHEQWVEFDTMGQYFGWGIGIADLMEDYRDRMKDAKAKNVTGVLYRTDWESLDGHSSFTTQNLINHYSAAMLSNDLDTPSDVIYRKYLTDEMWLKDDATEEQKQHATAFVRDVLSRTLAVTNKTPYVNGCVFSDSSLMPISLPHAFWLAEEKNSRRDWDASKWDALSPMQENVEFAIQEKAEALAGIQEIMELVSKDCDGLKPESLKLLRDRIYINQKYVSLYADVTKALMLARYVLETKEDKASEYYKEAVKRLMKAIERLEVLEPELRAFGRETDYLPFTIYTLLDPDRVRALRKDLSKRLAEAGITAQ